ncbi:hypothetical protein D3C86_1955980 [compost metagenome]
MTFTALIATNGTFYVFRVTGSLFNLHLTHAGVVHPEISISFKRGLGSVIQFGVNPTEVLPVKISLEYILDLIWIGLLLKLTP